MTGFHSSFTPSLSDPETLEALFVVRETLARDLMTGIRESATTGNKHQRLLIGPRGIGKSHLVSLVYHRVRADAELSAKLRIAWLPEDPYITGYATLLALILRQLRQDEADLGWLDKRLDAVLDLADSGQQETTLEQLLLECLDGRTLLLIAENLDDLLGALKDEGQKKLRAFIQNHRRVSILATTTSLTDALTERSKTFYGFFRAQTLQPFGVEEAATLLARLAKHADDMELANLVWSPMGLARVRALHYLAGGNPRIYAVFHDFLTRESLDELVTPFMKLMDELTPYYQSRMGRLAPLQRSILDALRRLRRAAPVKEIARQVMTSSQTVSTQLGKLAELGYVIQADSLGRSNYYELREPLMRLCLEVKEQRGRTVPLFIQFLRVWFSRSELDALANQGAARDLEAMHIREAAAQALTEEDPLQSVFARSIGKHLAAADYRHALEEIECALQRDPEDLECWRQKARCFEALDRPLEERLACWERVTEIDSEDDLGWNQQGVILSELGRDEEALEASAKTLALKPDSPVYNRNYGWDLKRDGRHAEARNYFQKAIDLEGEPKTAADWHQRANDLQFMDRYDDALQAYRKALELEPRRISAWGHLLGMLQEQGEIRLFNRLAERLTTLMPEEAKLQSYFGTAKSDAGDFEGASRNYHLALEIDPQLNDKGEPATLFRAAALASLGREAEALRLLENPLQGYSKRYEFRRALRHAHILMRLDRWDEGVTELDQLLQRSHPPSWSARDLVAVASLLPHTQNPHLWRRFITTWLDLFRKHGLLTELGEALVRSMHRFAIDWVTDQTARAWLQTWRELAGDIEEFALPLRLLAAGVDYKADRDPRALLGLAREERGLLEPWLINLFKQEPDEIDQDMEDLLHSVERTLEREAQEARSRAFWGAPAPSPETIDLASVLSEEEVSQQRHAAHLLPGHWQRLDRPESESLLHLLAEKDENGARMLSRPNLRVFGIERRDLSFSQWTLYQLHLTEDRRIGALDLLATADRVILLDGLSRTLYESISQGHFQLDSPESRSDYIRFFCSTVRGEERRFKVIDSLNDLLPFCTEGLPDSDRVQPWTLEQPDETGRSVYSGTILYSNALFRARLALTTETGRVDMLDDEPIAADLPIQMETFDGPIRWLASDPSLEDKPA